MISIVIECSVKGRAMLTTVAHLIGGTREVERRKGNIYWIRDEDNYRGWCRAHSRQGLSQGSRARTKLNLDE